LEVEENTQGSGVRSAKLYSISATHALTRPILVPVPQANATPKARMATKGIDMRLAKLYFISAAHITVLFGWFICAGLVKKALGTDPFTDDRVKRPAQLYLFAAHDSGSVKPGMTDVSQANATSKARMTTKGIDMRVAKLYSISAAHITVLFGWFICAGQVKKVMDTVSFTDDRVKRPAQLYLFAAHDSGSVKLGSTGNPVPKGSAMVTHAPVKHSKHFCSEGSSLSTWEMSFLLFILLCAMHGMNQESGLGSSSKLFNKSPASESAIKLGDIPKYCCFCRFASSCCDKQ